MDADNLIAQLRAMYDSGIRSVCLHPVPKEFRKAASDMAPPYLSDEYFAIIREVVKEADRLGMHYYLYDEGGWPSGSAAARSGRPIRNRANFMPSNPVSESGIGLSSRGNPVIFSRVPRVQ